MQYGFAVSRGQELEGSSVHSAPTAARPANTAEAAAGARVGPGHRLGRFHRHAPKIGDERDNELKRIHEQMLYDEATHAGAEIIKWTGDGIFAVFWSPSAAIDAACSIQKRVAEHNAHPLRLAPVSVRAGIAVGEAEVRSDDISGDPAIEASRLCGLASGSQILCSELVRRLSPTGSGRVFTDFGEIELKGYDRPTTILSLEWRSLPEARIHDFPGRLADLSPFGFAGRSVELDELRSAWAETSGGHTTLVLVAGEAGVGKSRLATESAREAHTLGAEILYGRCDPSGTIPYQPFAEALAEHVLRHHGLTGRPDTDSELARLLPERPDSSVQHGVIGANAALIRFYAAVVDWLDGIASARPGLLIIDDLGWSDRATLDLLVHIVENVPAMRLMVIATYRNNPSERSDQLVDALGRLRPLRRVRHLPLTGLDEEEIIELLKRSTEHPLDEVERGFAARLLDLTGGNPFLVTEVVSWLARQGTLADAARTGWPASTDGTPIPSGVADVVAQRLLSLPDSVGQHLRSAALIGPEFELAILAELSGGIPAKELLIDLEKAIAAGILREVEDRLFSFRFAHDLVRETLLLGTSSARAALLHQEIGEAIERIHAKDLDPHAAALGQHLAMAGDRSACLRAVSYLTIAAQRALDQAAPGSASRHLERALELAQDNAADDVLIAHLTYKYGVALRRSGSIESKGVLLQAGRLAEKVHDPDLFIQAALSNSRGMFSVAGRVDGQRVESLERALELLDQHHGGRDWRDRASDRAALLASLSEELTYHPDRERTADLSRQAEDLARRIGDRSSLIRALAARHSVLWYPAAYRERVLITEELEKLTTDSGDQWEATAMSFGFQAAVEGGHSATATRRLERLRELADVLGQPAVWAYTHLWSGVLATIRGDLGQGERSAGKAYELNLQVGSPDAGAWLLGQLYPIRWHQGRLAELESAFIDGLSQFPNLPVLTAALANIRAETGDIDGCHEALSRVPMGEIERERAHLDQLVAVACLARTARHLQDESMAARLIPLLEPYADQHVTNGSCHFGSVQHYLGLVYATVGNSAAALDSFEAAWRANERLGAAPLVARTHLAWAGVLLNHPDPEERLRSQSHLADARSIAVRLELAGILRDVEAVEAVGPT